MPMLLASLAIHDDHIRDMLTKERRNSINDFSKKI